MRYFLEPGSVALIGVPRKSGIGAYNNLEVMLRYGYKGRIYVVHPKAEEICGHKTYASIKDLPEVPELAVISIGRDRVLDVLKECAEKGSKNIVIISQGFKDADEMGKKLQEDLGSLAREKGIRLLGPNTMGVLNAFFGFSTAFVDVQRDPQPRPLSLVPQSGILQVGIESFTERVGKALDLGNSADLDFVDALDYLEKDPETEIIALHMEGLKRGREFLKTAFRVSRKKPILVFKTGRSKEGARAALSHTGSMVGEDSVYEKAFSKAGIVRVRNMLELSAASRAFLNFKPMQGPRIAVITAAGAAGIIALDAFADYGLKPAPLVEEIGRQLESSKLAWHKLHNPVDIWPIGMVTGSFTRIFKEAGKLLLKDDQVDGILGVSPVMQSELHKDLDMRSCLEELQEYNPMDKPIAMFAYGDAKKRLEEELENVPNSCCFSSLDEAVMGLAATWRYVRGQEIKKGQDKKGNFLELGPGKEKKNTQDKGVVLGEKSFDLLKEYKIPVVPGGLCQDLASARSLAEELGYPVSLKIVSSDWVHKSDLGGVKLNISNLEDLENAFEELKDKFIKLTPDGKLEGILVQRHLKGLELVFGIKRDPQFGPVVLAGLGGIQTEIIRDVSQELAPVLPSEAESMLGTLKCYPLLKGYRGQSGADLESLKGIILSLSRLAIDYPELQELDLNPVMAQENGAWCVDSRIVFG